MAHPDYQLARNHKIVRKTNGNYVGTTNWADVTGVEITLSEVEAGDTLVATLSAWVTQDNANFLFLDATTYANAVLKNSFALAAAASTGATGDGNPAWMVPGAGGAARRISGNLPYTVVADDIYLGNVVVRLRARASATPKDLDAVAATPIIFMVQNIGPQDPY